MTALKDYEQQVVRLLTPGVLSPQEIDSVIREGELVEYDYTGCGYFLTIRHPALPVKRVVCDEPKLAGIVDGIDSGVRHIHTERATHTGVPFVGRH
jgi:hypothetical protein